MSIAPEKQNNSTKEKLSKLRREFSTKVGRFASWITFDARTVNIADFDNDNPEKYEQDVAFASYEPNLRESHYQEDRERREYQKQISINTIKHLGVYVSFLPGVKYIDGLYKDFKFETNRSKQVRAAYKKEHGTIVTHAQQQWKNGLQRIRELNDDRAEIHRKKERD